MPVLREWDLGLDADMVLRAQGADPERLRERDSPAVSIAEEALAMGLPLLAPTVAYRRLQVEGFRHQRLLLEGGGRLNGPLVAEHLHAAKEVVAMVCTIGAALEEQASACFPGDAAMGVALDGLGSAAVDALAAHACRWVDEEAAQASTQTTIPLSPGLVGWTVSAGQPELFALVGSGAAGVRLNANRMMIPHKSTSLVIGLGPDVVHAGEECDYCSLRETCRYRKEHQRHHE